MFGEIVKDNQQLRCMDAVTESGTLLVGTNTFTILTQQITEWINFNSDEFPAIEDGSNYEERKYEEYDGSDYDGYGREERDDILEGRTLDEHLDEIYANSSKDVLA